MTIKLEKQSFKSNDVVLTACMIGVSIACVGLIATNQPILFYICASYLTFLGAWTTLTCITRPNEHSLALLLGGSLAFAYGFGTLNTEIRYISNDTDLIRLNFITREELTLATSLILFITSTLSAIGTRIKHKITTKDTFSSISNNGSLVFGAFTVITCAALISTGKIGFNLNLKSDQGGVSPLAQIALTLIAPACGMLSAKLSSQNNKQKILALTLICACLCIQLVMGRRVFLFTALVCIACFYATNNHSRLLTKRNIAIVALAIPTILFASKAFLAMRFASWQLPENTHIGAIAAEALDILNNPDRSGIDHKAEENEQTRTFVIGYFAELLKHEQNKGPLYGELLKFSTALVVPSSIWPEKSKFIALGFEEAIIHPHFGLPIWDGANSLLTTGLCDFGVAGAVIYPLIIGIIISIIPTAVRKISFNQINTTPVSIGLIYVTLSVEAALAAYLTSTRDLLFICIAFTVISLITNKLSQPR